MPRRTPAEIQASITALDTILRQGRMNRWTREKYQKRIWKLREQLARMKPVPVSGGESLRAS